MVTTYAKTADGVREIATRERRLVPRVRAALILVDGKRSDVELAKLVQQPGETLQALLDAGLIGVVASSAPATGVAPSAPAAVPRPAPSATLPQTNTDWLTLRRDAARAVNDLLGPEGDPLALRLERAANVDELQAALLRVVAYLGNARGGNAAAKFSARFVSGAG